LFYFASVVIFLAGPSILLGIATSLLLYFKDCPIYFYKWREFYIFIINFNYHKLPPGVTSPRTHIVPITGVQVIVELPSGTTACKSNESSATTDLYFVPQFAVISSGAVTVTMLPSTVTGRSSRTSEVGS
jgi:hypothetical protein